MSRGRNPLRACQHVLGEDKIFQLPDTCFMYVHDDVNPKDVVSRGSCPMGLQWTTGRRIVMTSVDLVGVYKLCRTPQKDTYERYAIVHGMCVGAGTVIVRPSETDRILWDIGFVNEAVQYVFIVRSRKRASADGRRRVVLLLRDAQGPNVLHMTPLGVIDVSVDYADNEAVLPPDPKMSLWQFFSSMRACSETHTDSACACPALVERQASELAGIERRCRDRPLPRLSSHRDSKMFHYGLSAGVLPPLVHCATLTDADADTSGNDFEDDEDPGWIVWGSCGGWSRRQETDVPS